MPAEPPPARLGRRCWLLHARCGDSRRWRGGRSGRARSLARQTLPVPARAAGLWRADGEGGGAAPSRRGHRAHRMAGGGGLARLLREVLGWIRRSSRACTIPKAWRDALASSMIWPRAGTRGGRAEERATAVQGNRRLTKSGRACRPAHPVRAGCRKGRVIAVSGLAGHGVESSLFVRGRAGPENGTIVLLSDLEDAHRVLPAGRASCSVNAVRRPRLQLGHTGVPGKTPPSKRRANRQGRFP